MDHGTSTRIYRDDGTADADFDGPEVGGVRVVLESVVAVLQTDAGAVFYSPTTGVSRPLQSLQNATLDAAELRRIEAEYVQAAEEQCEGVVKAVLSLRSATPKGVELVGSIYTDEGPGQLQVTASAALVVLFPGSIV